MILSTRRIVLTLPLLLGAAFLSGCSGGGGYAPPGVYALGPDGAGPVYDRGRDYRGWPDDDRYGRGGPVYGRGGPVYDRGGRGDYYGGPGPSYDRGDRRGAAYVRCPGGAQFIAGRCRSADPYGNFR
ncbi:hypothetical protein U0C82_08015 [Fulvimarina sp. 2208YS6-2-32]|uniref:Lipoprotein n=1 Tax=Fulvimarina uroteuthidis TaxID=3098149 RepID=A0ABU5I2P1_9HYPH|nr:hypothetical protein [Fulvimarina sp. 2208YS6-2-32]MDY8109089.1 hypothetical protein [Fulvimarina sp. 2208YS6-2-32]